MTFRTLYADEIECRVQTVVYAEDGNKGCSLLLYKDARCDMNILDKTVGVMNWKKSYELIDGQLFCTIEIWDEDKKQWIGKQDVGVESHTEEVKGRVSDAQKRSAFAFGIGRELYTAPFIWIDGNLIEWKKDSKGKMVPKTTFSVDYIDYDDKRRISALEIKTNKGNIVWTMGQAPEKPKKETKPKKDESTPKAEETKPVEVLCPLCDKPVKQTRSKGVLYEPMDVLVKLGGMCPDCYKKMKNESKNQ